MANSSESETKPTENDTNSMKNISPFMSKDLILAAGFNVEAPIVEAIIGNLTGSLPTKKTETEIIRCKICDCELSSNNALTIHTNGLRHKKRLKALEIIAQLKEAKDNGVNFIGDDENPKSLRCDICATTVNSAQQLEIHLSGAKHKRNVVKASLIRQSLESGNTEDCKSELPPPKKRKEESKITCDICNIFVNSQTQYDEHLLSKKHMMKAKRTSPKQLPRYTNFIQFRS